MFKRALLAASIALVPGLGAAQTVEELQQQIDILAQEIEALKAGSTGGSALDNLHIGGYGEIHYNNYFEDVKNDKIDVHRFVLYFGYDFNERVRFFSELELEHSLAGEGKPGEVELEQAYVEVDTSANSRARVGLFLVPVGILNETHEPDTFYGVERNRLESQIIPTTWWEAGAMFSQDLGGGLSYDIAGHSGLNLARDADDDGTFDSFTSIRSGRQKVAEAVGNKGAVTGRLRYAGVPGLDMAVSAQYQQDVAQDLPGLEPVSGRLLEAHARYNIGPATFTAMYAGWEFDENIGNEAAEEQNGWYGEAAWRFTEQVGVFARHTRYDTGAGDSVESEVLANTLGVNYWIVPTVVLKADYDNVSYKGAGDDDADDSFNLGLGWSF